MKPQGDSIIHEKIISPEHPGLTYSMLPCVPEETMKLMGEVLRHVLAVHNDFHCFINYVLKCFCTINHIIR